MQLCCEKAEGVVTNKGDIEICDFMRAAESVLYYFPYEGIIYGEKCYFQENVNENDSPRLVSVRINK